MFVKFTLGLAKKHKKNKKKFNIAYVINMFCFFVMTIAYLLTLSNLT